MPHTPDFDVAVVGGSIAGCSAARFFALAGARVALIEKRPDPAAYKVVCTHQIQSSAAPTIERLGLAPLLADAGAARSRPAGWTPYSGWLQFPADMPAGYGITRKRLDPMLRSLAVETPGVEYLPGRTAVGLLCGQGRVEGVETESPDGSPRALRARLTVAADGRDTTLARLARVPARVLPHNRFAYFAYWRGVPGPRDEARLWLMDPDVAAVFPMEDGLTLVATMPHASRLAEFRADLEAAYMGKVGSLPEGPDLSGAERVSELVGKLELPNKMRPAARPGLAFVGDAALAADPLFGVGCGWAFQSAEWLADAAAPALLEGGDATLDSALDSYRRRFRRRLGPEHLQIADFATGRRMRANERLAFRAAARDPAVAAAFEAVLARRKSVLWLLDPRLQPRILSAALSGS